MLGTESAILSDELSILLVSPCQENLEKLQDGLKTLKKDEAIERTYNCSIHICRSIQNIVQLEGNVKYFDYIVFIINPQQPLCIKMVTENISLLGNSYQTQKKGLAVIDCNFNCAIKPPEFHAFAQSIQANVVMGSMKNEEKIEALSKRLLNIIEVSCGIHNGIELNIRRDDAMSIG